MPEAAKAAPPAVADPARPGPPPDLQAPGKALWKAIVGDLADGWELDARELHLLHRAARCADEVAELEAAVDRDGATVAGSRGQVTVHPAIAEARQLRLTELRLLRDLELLDPSVSRSRATPSARRARRAAETRWRKAG